MRVCISKISLFDALVGLVDKQLECIHMPTLTCQNDNFSNDTTEVLTKKQLNMTLKFRILCIEHNFQLSQYAVY